MFPDLCTFLLPVDFFPGFNSLALSVALQSNSEAVFGVGGREILIFSATTLTSLEQWSFLSLRWFRLDTPSILLILLVDCSCSLLLNFPSLFLILFVCWFSPFCVFAMDFSLVVLCWD